MRRSHGSENGFTLIEALIAIIVLVFGLIAITNLFVVATASNQMGNLATAAAVRSSETLEKLKAVPFTSLVAGGDLTTDKSPGNGTTTNTTAEVLVGGALTYNCQEIIQGVGLVKSRWLVTAINPGTGDNVFYITVRSEVDGAFGRSASRAQFATFRTCSTPGCPNVPVS